MSRARVPESFRVPGIHYGRGSDAARRQDFEREYQVLKAAACGRGLKKEETHERDEG
jgi:hypothetical protein